MEERLAHIEQELQPINEHNRRVEADKAWETGVSRMLSIAVVTYMVAVFVLYLINVENFLLGALVPAVGFLLSVQMLPSLKHWWISGFLGE